MELEKYEFKSENKGPKILILGGVHGNEICGYRAIREIKNSLKLKKGELTLIVGNKRAIEKNVRFIEKDLNRCYYKRDKSLFYEEKVADEIMKIMQDIDYCLDLHASNSENTTPFQIGEIDDLNETRRLPVSKVLIDESAHYSSTSSGYLKRLGKKGIGVECGYAPDEKSIELAKKCILNYLASFDMADYEFVEVEREFFVISDKYDCKTSFSLVKDFADFEFVEKCQTIGFDDGEEIKVKSDGYIIFARNRDKPDNAFILCAKK